MNFLRNSKGAPMYMESSNCQSTIFLRIVFNLIFPTYNLDSKKLSKQGKETFCLFMYQYTTEEVYQGVNESFCIIRSSFLMCVYIYLYIFNWNSLHPRQNNHYKAWNYKKRSAKSFSNNSSISQNHSY